MKMEAHMAMAIVRTPAGRKLVTSDSRLMESLASVPQCNWCNACAVESAPLSSSEIAIAT